MAAVLCEEFSYKPHELETLDDIGLPLRIIQRKRLKDAAYAEETQGIGGLSKPQHDLLKPYRQRRL